jgi:hypothetical protein
MFDAKLETRMRPRRGDDLPERLADDTLGTREAGPLRVCRVTAEEIDAAVAELGQTTDVGAQAVHRCVVELPVARVEHEPRGGLDRDADRVRDRMRHAHELDAERAEVDRAFLRRRLLQLGRAQQAVLVELRLDEPERQSRRPDLPDTHLAHQERQRADMILVRVREHDGAHVLVVEVAEIREDHVDAEVLVARERHAGIDDDHLAGDLVDRHVLSNLAEPAERDHAQNVTHKRGSLVAARTMLSSCSVASTKRCKDAGCVHSIAMDATEDAAARSVIAGEKRTSIVWVVTRRRPGGRGAPSSL